MPDSPAPIGVERRELPLRWLWAGALMAALGLFLACDIASHPIVLWDESRLAVNALEMSQRGFSLVTTYGFAPDLWNTKPPLLIWLEAASIGLFGATEWAVRLPSLLAAIATLALVMRFSWRISGSVFVAGAAAVLLALSPGYFGEHAAQSGDYDTLLTFFTTAYVLLLFRVVHRTRPNPWAVMACGLLIAGACLTKGVAGLVPGVGVCAYLVGRWRWPRLFRGPWYLLAGVVVVALVGGFYLARERLAPGYLAAVKANELGGRFIRGMNGHQWPPDYYLQMLSDGFGLRWGYAGVAIAPFLMFRRNKSAAFLTYALVVILATLAVFTLSRTKIYWYIVPVYPLLAIAFAITLKRVIALMVRWARLPLPAVYVAAGVAAGFLAVSALQAKFVTLPLAEDIAPARYGEVFAALAARGDRNVVTLDSGVYNDDHLADYTPQLRFYALAWGARGLRIGAEDPNGDAALIPGKVLVSCDPNRTAAVAALGPPVVAVPGCSAVSGR